MRVLITGGGGFIGTHLAHLFTASGARVAILDRHAPQGVEMCGQSIRYIRGELEDAVALAGALDSVDVVYHLAWSGIHSVSNQDVSGHAAVNLLPTLKLLDACTGANFKRIVFLSSGGAVYGNTTAGLIREDHPTRPISAYGVAKLTAEAYFEFYWRFKGLEYFILRPSVPYGEWQNLQRGQGAVGVFLDCAVRRKPITIWGSGTTVRDYFYVGDLARACILAANPEIGRGIYNIGGGVPVTLNQLLDLVLDVTQADLHVTHEAERPFDPCNVVMDTTRARTTLLWKPTISLRAGIAKTWQWILSRSTPQALPVHSCLPQPRNVTTELVEAITTSGQNGSGQGAKVPY